MLPPDPSDVFMVTAWPVRSRFPSLDLIVGDKPASISSPSELMTGIVSGPAPVSGSAAGNPFRLDKILAVETGILAVPEGEAISGSRNNFSFWKKRSVGTPGINIVADPSVSVVTVCGLEVKSASVLSEEL